MTIAAATTPATTKAGAAQPPSVRPVDVRRDCGPGSRPGGKWGWPSRATAIERASCPPREQRERERLRWPRSEGWQSGRMHRS